MERNPTKRNTPTSAAAGFLAAVLPLVCCLTTAGAESLRLSSLDLGLMTTGWGQVRADRTVDNHVLTIAGKQYQHGVGTHAVSTLPIAVNGATRFTASVGVDDEVADDRASVEFVVVVDGKERWRSGVMKCGDAAKKVDVDLTGAREMVLKVTDGGDGVSYDHADWAEASLTYVGDPPQASIDQRMIRVATAGSTLTLTTDEDQRLYQLGYGASGQRLSIPRRLSREDEFHPPYGNGFILEPAVQVQHADGNTSTDLIVAGHQTTAVDANITLTQIELQDRFYPFRVTLFLRAYRAEDVIEQWAEIRHDEAGPVILQRFASAACLLRAESYWLSQFQGNYSREANLVEEHLAAGIKILDSKIGVRAHQMRNPSFLLALDESAREEAGQVYGGTLAWSGSFQFVFEIDWDNRLRILGGINPFGSQYHLGPGTSFTTPAMLWTYSDQGKGQVSRNFHRWARRYAVRDGDQPRPILLNNWEATYMDFDEQRIVSLFDGARELGIELFLLDDGWFGNNHPRNNDHAGLGDWQVNRQKLPHGLSYLAEEAKKRGLRFGIWTEPEMVNPASDLYERHPEWAIGQAHREPQTSRNQLALDLSRPAVREFVWQCIDELLGPNPGISYVKWDCNRYITQPGSSWLPPDRQSHLLIDYNWALYDVMARMVKKYPQVQAMVCSGGSGRVDYGSLKYFHSFWPSDNTDPLRRVFIQWGFSHIFPACTISAHATRMGRRPIKFTLDVAMSGAFGVDMDVSKLSAAERTASAAAVALYKQRLRELVQFGDLYRLESPYERPRAALNYVGSDRGAAVLFVYQLKDGEAEPIKPRGLDPKRRYRLEEVNLPAGSASQLATNGQVIDGAALMRDGLAPPCRRQFDSAIILITEVAGQADP
ncbi:MAG: alpha-galactosidase [Sedimentisphaerales bacterium]|nr:alpha-galactosidase [Sedimentisphaerales bacterium]